MAHAHEEALQMTTDSEEEYAFSSEDDEESEDESFHFKGRLNRNRNENVSPSGTHHTRAAGKRRSVFNAVVRLNKCDQDSEQIPAAKKARTLSWKAETDVDQVSQTLKFLPAREPGPLLSAPESHSPMSLFKLFFTESVMENLCNNTNAQAARAAAKGHKYKWTDVSVDEFYRYFGLVFYMATVKMSSIADYWHQDSIFSLPFPATIMSRDRYRTISWNIHMSDPGADEENDRKRGTAQHDRLFRIKPLMDTIRLACKALYHPRRSLVVNERLVACKVKREVITQMKAKLTKFKFFILSDSSNGYTVDFSVYTGKNSFPTDRGLSYDAVMSLLDCKTLGSGYHVYMDDFFTSHKLFTDLLALKFGACGAYRDQRKGFPETAANSLSRNSSKGSIRWIRDGPLVFVKWMDTQEVSVCSTVHAAYSGERVQRKIKSRHTWKKKSFPCPAPVTAYNQHMGGVDLSDQLLQYYAAQHKTMKWYRKVFLHFLDIAANNAFVLHKELVGNMTHEQFMEDLIAELCGVSQKAAPKQFSTDHVPIPGATLTTVVRRIASLGRRICVRCRAVLGKKQQTPWKCKACNVHLCLQLNRNCFKEWHKNL